MDELTIGDKIYISSKRAAVITGYAKDYVGQLCREGHVEAKMVGRSWYVLESSIRAHRFGASVENVEQNAPKEKELVPTISESAGLPETWEAPKYVAEEAPRIPELLPSAPVLDVRETAHSLDISDSQRSLTEMQAAWREWFESKHEPLLESPEVIEAREEAEEAEERKVEKKEEVPVEEPVPIIVHRIPEVRPRVIDTSHVQMPVSVNEMSPRPYKPAKSFKRPTNLVVIAILVVVAGLTIAIGIVGSGFADAYLEKNAVIKYLGGASSINK